MTSTDSVHPVNSPQWWDDYFRHHWDRNGGAAQTRHFMRRLIEELPDAERRHLAESARSILDWGCAHGEGVDELARAFGADKVLGVDVAPAAVAEAKRRFPAYRFELVAEGDVPRRSEVVVCSNCLEHFAEPWAVAERLARAAEDLLIVLVPHAEEPLCASHVVRFDADRFPESLADLRRIAGVRVAVDPEHWAGEQFLAIYASPRYLAARAADGSAEKAKWDRHYANITLEAESEVMARFGAEFAALVGELLPEGGRVLEAGAGAGWHSLALARTGRFSVTLLDFSEHALRHARALFAREDVPARFVLGDARAEGPAEYDLVFNSGVLEHLAFAEQAALLRAMASRSRAFVLALVPNRHCYWYHVWRLQAGARGDWTFGREAPAAELGAVFAAAELPFAGERVLGADWTESFFAYLQDVGPRLLECLRAVHRSPALADEAKGYLRAGLGRVAGAPARAVPAGWRPSGTAEPPEVALLAGALADALALQVRSDGALRAAREECRRAREDAEQRARDVARLEAGLRAAAAAAERSAAEQAAAHAAERASEHDAWERRLTDLADRLAHAEQEQARLTAALRTASDERDRLASERGELRDLLHAARAALGRTESERDALAAANEELHAWREVVERSRAFRMLRRFDRVRGALRLRRPR